MVCINYMTRSMAIRRIVLLLFLVAGCFGCREKRGGYLQGYIEGDYVYLSSPVSGYLSDLAIAKGDEVQADQTIAILENDQEMTALAEADARVRQAQSNVDDLEKGLRPTELDALTAKVRRMEAVCELSSIELERQSALRKDNANSQDALDRARMQHQSNLQQLEEAKSNLATGRLGGRSDTIAAAKDEVNAAKKKRGGQQWRVEQMTIKAPNAGTIDDTLYRHGEWVPAGRPVAVLLPPENIKIRFFIPESLLTDLKIGQKVQVSLSSRDSFEANINYIATDPEFTPPVIYSRDMREKLVYMVEAAVDEKSAVNLHPGQPVDVVLGSGQ